MLVPLLIYCTAICFLCFWLFGADKRRARRHARRIPEKSLIALSLLGGGLGAWAGMYAFRHKTLHRSFRILVPLGTVIWVLIIAAVFLLENLDILPSVC